MRVIFAGETYDCLRAVRTEDRATLYLTDGGTVEFIGVSDFSVFTFEDGNWAGMTADEARALRDKLLAETDWTELMDTALSTASKKEFRAYRQALRDVPQQAGYPNTINWPVKPEAVKADPEPVEDIVDAIIGEEGLE